MARATVGLLFSDIEGSTRLLQALGAAYGDVLLEHHRLMRDAFTAHGGTERGNEGDSFFVTFPTAADAVRAALDAQRALGAHTWPRADATVRVRMGVHVGAVEEIGGALVGMALHEAARIASAAHGGQVLASELAASLATTMPANASWRDLGPHRLKDLDAPVHLVQLMHPAMRSEFPPVRAHGAIRNNLPAQPTAFIGRRDELDQVNDLLRSSRLLTLTGPGGSGKSRMALTVAAAALPEHPDGAWFIDLAVVIDPLAVPAYLAAAIGISEVALDDVCAFLGDKRALLVFDNCEHLVDAVSASVSLLLARCPTIVVMATSREPLGIAGEVVWRVPPLTAEDAAELLRQRARAVNPKFVVTEDNRGWVDEVCRRLDAIPLALELAAARLGTLSVDQLAQRLDQRFRLLAGGVRGGLERHRTLQATVDWSYDLLSPPEQQLLCRLGTFVGGFTLEGADVLAPADFDAITVVEVMDQLVRKSLVIAEQDCAGVRYRLLETVRQYALDKLGVGAGLVAARDAHLAWAHALIVDAGKVLWFGGDEASALERLDTEESNLRAAFDWALDRDQLHTATTMLFEWFGWFTARGRPRDGFHLTRRLLTAGVADEDLALAAVLEMAFASNFSALEPVMIDRVRETTPLLTGSSYEWVQWVGTAYAAAWSYPAGDRAAAAVAVETCRSMLAAAAGAPPGIRSWLLQPLMWVHLDAGDLQAARATADEAVAVAEQAGLSHGESRMTLNRARIELQLDELDDAWADADRAARVARGTGETFVAAAAVRVLAQVAERRDDRQLARDLLASILDNVTDTHAPAEIAAIRADLERLTPRAS